MGKKDEMKSGADDALQALIVADSFDAKFGPITRDKPRCLLPLCNRPLLGYALEFLKNSGVRDVFVYCKSHAPLIKEYLRTSEWGSPWARSMSITTITNENCRTFGDAMRDMDGKGLLRHDFILLCGDTVSNAALAPIMEEHKRRCQDDPCATATLVFKECTPGHHCRISQPQQETALAADAATGKILFQQRVAPPENDVSLPLEIFDDCPEVDVRFDVMPTGIAICRPSVPPLFADNFDCQTLDELVKSILGNDLLDNTVYHATVKDDYAVRVSNLATYSAVAKDVLNRWTFPLVPDLHKTSPCKYERRNVYRSPDVHLERGSVLEEDVILGSGCSVGGGGTRLRGASVGARCRIGRACVIEDCIVHDDVEIGDDCRLEQCVIGQGVKLGRGASVGRRSVLGPGVEIAAGAAVPADARLAAQPDAPDDDGFSDDDEADVDGGGAADTGLGPKAFLYRSCNSRDSDSDASATPEDAWGETPASDEEEEEEDSSDGSSSSGASLVDHGGLADIDLNDDFKLSTFHGEVMESLLRGAKEGLGSDNLTLEINSSKHAYNMRLSQVNESVITSLLAIPRQIDPTLTGTALLVDVKSRLRHFHGLLANYIKTSAAQKDCLRAIEQHCEQHAQEFLPIVMKVVHYLYEADVLTEEAIFAWYNDVPADSDGDEAGNSDTSKAAALEIREKLRPFLKWLREADSDGSDEESD